MASFRLIVGLGNPGREYADTRHNVGFIVLDHLAAGTRFRAEKKWGAEVASRGNLILCKPQNYMNLSGQCVSAVGQFYKIEPHQMLIVLDDMALPLGRLRLRESGSHGGHNGLRNIIDHLGTSAIPRLRIGIGSAEPGASSDHVLGRFSKEECPVLERALTHAVEAIEFAQNNGLAAAMNQYNPKSNNQ